MGWRWIWWIRYLLNYFDNYSTCSAKKTPSKRVHTKAQKSPRSDSSEPSLQARQHDCLRACLGTIGISSIFLGLVQFLQLLLLQAFFHTFRSAKPKQGIVWLSAAVATSSAEAASVAPRSKEPPHGIKTCSGMCKPWQWVNLTEMVTMNANSFQICTNRPNS